MAFHIELIGSDHRRLEIIPGPDVGIVLAQPTDELLGPLGMVGIDVSRGTEAMDGGKAAYTCVVTVTFESREAMDNGFSGERRDRLLNDIANFTDVEPIIQVSEVLL